MGMKTKGYTPIMAPIVHGMGDVVYNQAYSKGDCNIWVSREVHGGCLRWHMSISCKNRYPTWEEQRDARYDLLPDNLTMAMLLPPKREYVNVHPNCFHWHEIVE
jgi:hypothetical protein